MPTVDTYMVYREKKFLKNPYIESFHSHPVKILKMQKIVPVSRDGSTSLVE